MATSDADLVQATLAQLIGVRGPNGNTRTWRISTGQRDEENNGRWRRHCFALLPSARSPRWMLPMGNAGATTEGFRIYTPYRTGARVLKSLVVLLIQTGWEGWARDRVLMETEEPCRLEALVRHVTGETEPAFAIALSEPSFRKFTVQAMSAEGRVLGYLKLPLGPEGERRVRHEAQALSQLADFPTIRAFIPQVLYAGDWEGDFVLFTSPGGGQPGPTDFGPLQERFLRTLRTLRPRWKPGAVLVQEITAAWEAVARQHPLSWQPLCTEALQRAGRRLDDVPVPCGFLHGDFTPFNTQIRNGELFVFDWELSEPEAPIWWDTFHFREQVARAFNRSNGGSHQVARTPVEKACLLLYLVRSLTRVLERRPTDSREIDRHRRRLLQEFAREASRA